MFNWFYYRREEQHSSRSTYVYITQKQYKDNAERAILLFRTKQLNSIRYVPRGDRDKFRPTISME